MACAPHGDDVTPKDSEEDEGPFVSAGCGRYYAQNSPIVLDLGVDTPLAESKVSHAVKKPPKPAGNCEDPITKWCDKTEQLDFTVVYTDGSAGPPTPGAKPTAGIGVFWGDESPFNISERIGGLQTNNRAEIMACVRAIQQASLRKIPNLEIRTDSEFVVKTATKWIHQWTARGWKDVKGSPIKCGTECKALRHFQNTFEGTIAYMWVPGHQGIYGNERADALAKAGAAKGEKTGFDIWHPLPMNEFVYETQCDMTDPTMVKMPPSGTHSEFNSRDSLPAITSSFSTPISTSVRRGGDKPVLSLIPSETRISRPAKVPIELSLDRAANTSSTLPEAPISESPATSLNHTLPTRADQLRAVNSELIERHRLLNRPSAAIAPSTSGGQRDGDDSGISMPTSPTLDPVSPQGSGPSEWTPVTSLQATLAQWDLEEALEAERVALDAENETKEEEPEDEFEDEDDSD